MVPWWRAPNPVLLLCWPLWYRRYFVLFIIVNQTLFAVTFTQRYRSPVVMLMPFDTTCWWHYPPPPRRCDDLPLEGADCAVFNPTGTWCPFCATMMTCSDPAATHHCSYYCYLPGDSDTCWCLQHSYSFVIVVIPFLLLGIIPLHLLVPLLPFITSAMTICDHFIVCFRCHCC